MEHAEKEKTFAWVKSTREVGEIYANMINPAWTLFDVRLIFGQLIGVATGDPKRGFNVEEQAAVTMSWPQAKILRDVLVNLIANYEKTNGEINTKPALVSADNDVTPRDETENK